MESATNSTTSAKTQQPKPIEDTPELRQQREEQLSANESLLAAGYDKRILENASRKKFFKQS